MKFTDMTSQQSYHVEEAAQFGQRPTRRELINWNAECPQKKPKTPRKVLGSIKVKYLLMYFMPLTFIAPLYTYYMAVSHKQELPYPAATITMTACHYPQATGFRFMNLQAGSFLSLVYYLIARWLVREKKRIHYPGHLPNWWLFYLTELSILGFFAAIGTVDIGGTGDLHNIGAVFFFIVLYLAVLNYTLIMRKMHHWDRSFMTRSSFVIKSVLCLYVSLVAIYFLLGSIFDSHSSKYVVVIEWNLVLICEIWVFSFWQDWKNLKIHLNTNGRIRMQNEIET